MTIETTDGNAFSVQFSTLLDKASSLLWQCDFNFSTDSTGVTTVDFEVGSIPVVFVHSPLAQSDRFFFVCRFGVPPQEKKAEILERLLEINFDLASQPISFAIDSDTAEVILAAHYALIGPISRESIRRLLKKTASSRGAS